MHEIKIIIIINIYYLRKNYIAQEQINRDMGVRLSMVSDDGDAVGNIMQLHSKTTPFLLKFHLF